MSRRSRKPSLFALQLREKQKIKRFYGVQESQFKNYVEKASRLGGPRGENLATLLENRLDNVIYRLGFSASRPAARQMIIHGHVKFEDHRVLSPSFQVKPMGLINFTSRFIQTPIFQAL